jgi:hypothetical protein
MELIESTPSAYVSAGDVVVADALSVKAEAFAQAYCDHGNASRALREAFDTSGMSRATIKTEAYRMVHSRPIAARIATLRAGIAEAFVANVANLRARQYEIAVAEPLTEVRVFNCRACHGVSHKHQWRDTEEFSDAVEQWAITKDSKPQPQPSMAGGVGFDPFATPAEDCPECLGAGRAVVYLRDTTTLSPAQRAAFKGASVDRWGQIHVEQHDAQDAAHELARMIPGAIAPQRSESKVAHVHVEPLRDLTPEQIVALMAEQKLIT